MGYYRYNRRRYYESKLQSSCVKYFRLNYRDLLLYSIPNGGLRDKRNAAILKREGVMPGVPDLFLAHPSNGYHGLYIELKTGKNKLSHHQEKIIQKLEKENYKVAVCYSLDEFISAIREYLGEPIFKNKNIHEENNIEQISELIKVDENNE
jgi:hypothetical protein